MPRQLHWSELIGGIIATAVIAAAIVAIFLFARVGAMHGKKVTVYVLTDDATGVLSGTEVWLGGKKAGLVKNVAFRPPSPDTLERLVITTELLEEALPNVRSDSHASIRPGDSMIGAIVVYISPGTATSPQLHNGDTVHVEHHSRLANLGKDAGQIGPAFSELASLVKGLTKSTRQPVGTVGNARMRGLARLPDVSTRMSRIAAKLNGGNGTLALAARNDLAARVSHAMAAADSIRVLMSSNKGSVGRFRRDSTLTTKARKVRAEVDTLRALLADPVGSIAAAHSDSTLTRQLARTQSLLDSLILDATKHKGRYLNF
ncbi:MAG TPA: MlaD family protein [Gemmatimonadaceae bacterium]|jgi:ABC-type transporter Mla subunit MlaD|nr:MlaD family protein [Gemmatimonadaceae bacterium]